MTPTRRHMLQITAGSALLANLPGAARAQTTAASAVFAPKPGPWRTFEVTTRVEPAVGVTQAWIPIPSFAGEDWMRPGKSEVTAGNGTAQVVHDPKSGAGMVHVVWAAGEAKPLVEVVSRIGTRDRAVPLSLSPSVAPLTAEQRARYTAATELLPTGGIVKETADKITAGAASDLDKARRLYDWIADNTFRDPNTRGCGTGDIASMLKSGNLGGKCADLNALYVGLARASGLPARDIYGIRVAPSAFGYKSLGANAAIISKAQHCRAEVFVAAIGWIPVDPADVRKVVLEEPPGALAVDDPKVVAARRALFGGWETNWLAYNDAHDVALPGSKGPPVPFLMYPQGETAQGRLDSLDPDAFKYVMTTREIPA